MSIKWMQVVIDLPRSDFERGRGFWLAVSGCTAGEIHPDHDEYQHLLPPLGDPHLELQRIDDGAAGAHLDLLVEDIAAATARAVQLGAALVSNPGHSVLKSPGGVTFCIVPFSGESERTPLIDARHPHAIDQICLDVPSEQFDDEVAFWGALTSWETTPAGLEHFVDLRPSEPMPFRILLQRLGDTNAHEPTAHLDISCGQHVEVVTARHQAAGATLVERFEYWSVLRDPTGQRYCLTRREPLGASINEG